MDVYVIGKGSSPIFQEKRGNLFQLRRSSECDGQNLRRRIYDSMLRLMTKA